MVDLRTLKNYTIEKIEERGISMGQIAKTLEETLLKNQERLKKMGYETNIRQSDIRRFVSLAFENERLLQSSLVGIEIDELAEKGELREPLLSMIRADEPLMPVDETLVMGALDLDGVEEFGPIDVDKSGVIATLDKSKERVHTFMDDIIGGFVAQAFGNYLKEQNEKAHAHAEAEKYGGQVEPKIESERYPLGKDVFTKSVPPLPKLDKDVKKYDSEMCNTAVVKKAAVNQQKKQGMPFRRLGEASYRMQKKHTPSLTMEEVKKYQANVVFDKREKHALDLIYLEMDRKFQGGELSPMMMELMSDKKHFYPPRTAARQAANLYGGVAATNFDTLSNEVNQSNYFDPELREWMNDPRNVFIPEIAKLTVAMTNGKTVHDYKNRTDRRAERRKKINEMIEKARRTAQTFKTDEVKAGKWVADLTKGKKGIKLSR